MTVMPTFIKISNFINHLSGSLLLLLVKNSTKDESTQCNHKLYLNILPHNCFILTHSSFIWYFYFIILFKTRQKRDDIRNNLLKFFLLFLHLLSIQVSQTVSVLKHADISQSRNLIIEFKDLRCMNQMHP